MGHLKSSVVYMHDDSHFLKAKERSRAIKCHPVGQAGEEGRKYLEMRCMADQTE